MIKTKYLIVGAGISGLTFADWIKSDDYLVCEAFAEIGGYCRTVQKDGFTWDYSGHFFHFKNRSIEQYLVSRMSDLLTVSKETRILWKNELIDFPFQKNIHQLPKEDFIDCLYDLYFKKDGEVKNFKDMLYAKFGRSIAEKFLVPYNEKLYATDLATLDVDAMGRFFPYARLDEIIGNFRNPDNKSYNASFTYPRGGAIEYINALVQGVDQNNISLEERVLSLDLHARTARTNLRTIQFEYLINTAPFNQLLAMAGLDHDPNVYSSNKVLVFNIGFDSKGPENIHWIYLPQDDLCFYRVGFYDNILGTDRMSMYVEIGLPKDAELSEQAVESYKPRVIEHLRRCGLVTTQNPVAWHALVMDPAYVHITQESVRDVTEKKGVLSACGVYSIGRYGSWTYCSIEDNIIEARQLADTLNTLEHHK